MQKISKLILQEINLNDLYVDKAYSMNIYCSFRFLKLHTNN